MSDKIKIKNEITIEKNMSETHNCHNDKLGNQRFYPVFSSVRDIGGIIRALSHN